MSEWKVEVVRVGALTKHPNADTLWITEVHGGYPVIIKDGEFKEGDLAVYVPVDSTVPLDDPRWAFLGKHDRIKAKRLRGIFSMGLLTKSDPSWSVGQDVAEALRITRWDPEVDRADRQPRKGKGLSGSNPETEKDPRVMPVYDLEGLRKYKATLVEGEEVVVTEKQHGVNARYVWLDTDDYIVGGKFYVGSRNLFRRRIDREVCVACGKDVRSWVRHHHGGSAFSVAFVIALTTAALIQHGSWAAVPMIIATIAAAILAGFALMKRCPCGGSTSKIAPQDNVWWAVAIRLNLEEKLKPYPGIALYGEVYGWVQDLKYGMDTPKAKDGMPNVAFAAFDVFDTTTQTFYDHDDMVAFCDKIGVPTVPLLYRGPWKEDLRQLAEGPSAIKGADHMREGIVIRPVKERTQPGLGRVVLKLVGMQYLLRKEG